MSDIWQRNLQYHAAHLKRTDHRGHSSPWCTCPVQRSYSLIIHCDVEETKRFWYHRYRRVCPPKLVSWGHHWLFDDLAWQLLITIMTCYSLGRVPVLTRPWCQGNAASVFGSETDQKCPSPLFIAHSFTMIYKDYVVFLGLHMFPCLLLHGLEGSIPRVNGSLLISVHIRPLS